MNTYATLNQLKERLQIAADDTTNDTALLRALWQATAQIDRHTARRFAPTVQTRTYPYQALGKLHLDIDLLEPLTVTNGDGAAVALSDLNMLPEGDGPYYALALSVEADTMFTPGVDPARSIAVRGVWGWHDAWSEAWLNSGDSVQGGTLAADAATITVSDADGADGYGLTPRFQVGQILRIDTATGFEYLHVSGVNTTANTINVIRGVRGTSAASHSDGATIYVYTPSQDVQALCLRWATWLYQQVDAGIGAGADWLYPAELPPDVRQLAAPLCYMRVA